MIVAYEMLKKSLTEYKTKGIKIKRMSDDKKIIKLTRKTFSEKNHIIDYRKM